MCVCLYRTNDRYANILCIHIPDALFITFLLSLITMKTADTTALLRAIYYIKKKKNNSEGLHHNLALFSSNAYDKSALLHCVGVK